MHAYLFTPRIFVLFIGILVLLGGCSGSASLPSAPTIAIDTTPTAVLSTTIAVGGTTTPPTSSATSSADVQQQSNCTAVESIAPDSPEGRKIADALLAQLPKTLAADLQTKTLAFEEVRSIQKAKDWILLQANFKESLEPGIFVLRAASSDYTYSNVAWSGTASAAEIRTYLGSQLADVPPALLGCLEPAEWFRL